MPAQATIVYQQVTRDAQVALEEFKTDFLNAYQFDDGEQWAQELGLTIQTSALKVTLPVPISAAGYTKDLGDFTYRRLSEKHFSFVPEIWKDGFAEFAHVVEAPDFLGWQQEPRNMAAAAANLHQQLISNQLESSSFAGPTLSEFDGLTFFHASHPYHLNDSSVGMFANQFTGAGTDLTPLNVGKARQRFRQILGPNGYPLGIRLKGILVPAGLEETMKRIANQDLVPWASVTGQSGSQGQSSGSLAFGAVNNIYKGTQYWVSDHLANQSKWYAIGEKVGMYPWAVVGRGTPETLMLDKQSALYEREGKIGMRSQLQTLGALCFPHLIQQYDGTA
jgi:hypothetical protein